MRQDLINLIEKEHDVTNAIVLTHNIDFVFLQLVVLPALKRCGHPTLTIFADAACAAETFSYQSPILSGLGTRYRVVPVAMEPGFCFHPKAVLLSGPLRASLFVGSGNLTFGGWRHNAEIWVRFDSNVDGTGPFASFRLFLQAIVARLQLTETIQAEIQEAFDPNTRVWAESLDSPSDLLGKVDSGDALLPRMLEIFDVETDRIVICSPYFDVAGIALQELIRRVRPGHTQVLVQKGRSGLSKHVADGLGGDVKIVPVDCRHLAENEGARQRFIHAKFYSFEQQDRVLVFAGSANCSQAALLIPGSSGNAELMAIRSITHEEFRRLYAEDLELLNEAPELAEGKGEEQSSFEKCEIKIFAARFDAGELRLAFTCPPNIRITGGVVDNNPVSMRISKTIASVELDAAPRLVLLEGEEGNRIVRSNLMWVDNEKDLSSSARGRGVERAIRTGVRIGNWNFGAWAGILEIVTQHLQYLPDRPVDRGGRGKGGQGHTKKLDFLETDVFSATYDLPKLSKLPMPFGEDGRLKSLRQMLLRWFGISDQEDEDSGVDPPHGEQDTEGSNDEDETVDRPVPPPKMSGHTRKSYDAKPTKTEIHRSQKILAQLTDTMTAEKYLEKRSPELLASDIKIISVLLISAMSEGWLSREDFLAYTHKIWSSLFFSSELDKSAGAIETRFRSAESPEDFAESMASASLSAALVSWALSIQPSTSAPDEARFALTTILSVGRLPWLWYGADLAEIQSELAKLWRNTQRISIADLTQWETLENEWRVLIRRGKAINRFESAMVDFSVEALRGRIVQEDVLIGECLWQGISGFCVATMHFKRSVNNKVTVLRLQGKVGETKFLAAFAIPLRALLNDAELISYEKLSPEEREEIFGFVREMTSAFS